MYLNEFLILFSHIYFKQEYFLKAIEEMGSRSLRCVAIAYRNYDKDDIPVEEGQPTEWNLPEDDLVLLAIVGIKVPICTALKIYS